MQKKGEFSELFKYIFVLIAGLALLSVFIYFGREITETGEALSSTETREILDHYLTTLSTVEYISTPAELDFDTTINFNTPTCQQLTVEKKEGSSTPAAYHHLIYAPKKLTGNKLNIWSYGWRYPYRITNFFYINNNRVKTYIIGDQTLVTQLLKDIPTTMNIQQGTSTNINDYKEDAKNYDLVKIIVLGPGKAQRQENVLLITIQPEQCNEQPDGNHEYTCHGTVHFPEGNAPFNGLAMLYGTFFTTTLVDYQCVHQEATKELERISSIYATKQTLLRQQQPSCTQFNLNFQWPNPEQWHTQATSLATQNENLGGRTCAFIF